MIEKTNKIILQGILQGTAPYRADRPKEAKRPVLDEYGQLAQEIERLEEACSALRTQLSPIVGPPRTTTGNGDPHPPEASFSIFAESIRSDKERVRTLREMINLLRDSIDI